MSRFINTELKSDLDSDSEVGSKSDNELMGKIKIWFWFWIRHFTFNKFYSYVFPDFEQVLFMPIFLTE